MRLKLTPRKAINRLPLVGLLGDEAGVGAAGGVGGAEIGEPFRAGTLATVRAVVAMGGAGKEMDDRFEAAPEIDRFQDWVHQVRSRAVVGILRVGVVECMLPGRLQHVDVLEEGDDGANLCTGHMRPLVNLVRVDVNQDKQPQLPTEVAEPSRPAQNHHPKQQEVPRALPPVILREEPRVVVVNNVWLDHQRADYGSFLGAVGVFQPMDEASHKISQHDDAQRLENDL